MGKNSIDWTGRHTPAWAAINGAGISALTASVGYLADAPLWVGLAEGAAGALAAAAVATRRRYAPGHRLYRAAAWLAAGGWTSWAMSTGPWASWMQPTALVAGTTLAWGCSVAYEAYEADLPERRRQEAEQAAREEAGDAWEDRLKRVCGVAGCQVVAVEEWETGMGYTLEVQLPPGGHTVDDIRQHTLALRADMRLKAGCSLEVEQGEDYGTVIVRVNTKDAIAELVPIPMDGLSVPRSINDSMALGVYRDGFDAEACLRFHCGLIIGQIEGGKTNLLNVINAMLMRCNDVLIWHIDTTGAGITLPWLRSWAREGTADRPAIDWAANTVEEAVLMCRVAVEIIEARKLGYQDLMYQVNDDKVPVSADLPEIFIISDEVAQLPEAVQQGISDVINTGRASGVRSVNSALRGTRDMVSAAMKEQTRLRIAMRVSDESEYHHVFSDARGIKKGDAPVQGSGFFEYDGAAPRAFKAYRIEPSDIPVIAAETARYRPVLDEVSRNIPSGQIYAERWERTLPSLYKPGTPLSPAAQKIADRVPAPVPQAPASPAQNAPQNGPHEGLSGLLKNLFPVSGAQPPAEPAAPAPAPVPADIPAPAEPVDTATRQEFNRVLDDATWHLGDPVENLPAPPALGAATAPAEVTDPVQLRALEIIDQVGPAGIGVTALADRLSAEPGMSAHRTTVQRWMSTWAVGGQVVRQGSGSQVVYIRPWHDPISRTA
jgi:S-DNA-T family DNA segregation ATPase FtsK/SpoIIIE